MRTGKRPGGGSGVPNWLAYGAGRRDTRAGRGVWMRDNRRTYAPASITSTSSRHFECLGSLPARRHLLDRTVGDFTWRMR